MNACELTTFITAVANILAKNNNPDETAVLAAMFTQFGDTLATILAMQDIDDSI